MAKDVEAERLLIIKAARVANAAFIVVSPYDLLFLGINGGIHKEQRI
ncbi:MULTISPECIES: hypothetical protein [unclassified Prosthecochloris]|nr:MULTISPECIES: hypothetical protein [unclassified Prosthecochloris]UZJ37207.1 hypothetical protein OO005_10690 [Prosthecochloris sp. SCSIO W1103]UZJ39020.1 hypothetical protein OO185_03535 [Prosthecochloris sp. SCSIO W1102]